MPNALPILHPTPKPPAARTVLEATAVAKVFPEGHEEVSVLNGVDIALAAGEIVALEGPSGRSATLRLHGQTGLSAEGATLRSRGLVTEATVAFPVSERPFARAEVALTAPRARASFPRNLRPSKDLKAATSTR